MRRLSVFNQVSLDGYFCDDKGDMSWAHRQDPEWAAFMAENASGDGALVFGRITYELMVRYWPTAAARDVNPAVARRMTELPKIVFSRTLVEATWENTVVVHDGIVEATRKMKAEPGPDMVILGSGSIVAQLTAERLIDTYTLVLSPIVLGSGRTMFDGLESRLSLTRVSTRAFDNGNVVLQYEPA